MTGAARLRRGAVAAGIRRHRLVCILRRIEPRARLLALVDDLAADGARVFEITFDASTAVDDLVAVRERLGAGAVEDGFLVGAGTLLTTDALAAAADAGADFGVSPVFDPALVAAALEAGLPFVPAGMTPTEIIAAWRAGATFVKLFPASAVGPGMVRELRGPLTDIELIPTGGIGAGDARDFLDAGAAAIGIGGALGRMEAPSRRALIASIAGRR